MSRYEKVFAQVLNGQADANVSFSDLCNLLLKMGFATRTSGSHRIFCMSGVEELINLQKDGNKAKPYQVKQVRYVIMKYHLGD